jgi:hypothetical protein
VDDPQLRPAILRILARWGRLPESDLVRWLPPPQTARLRPEVYRALVDEGLVELHEIGDERVLAITERGRATVERPL